MSQNGDLKKKVIGTHHGKFHCDEVFACFLLKQLPQYFDAEILRTRDPAILDKCDIVVDVGGVYDHEKRRYDHHQKSFTHTMQSLGILPKFQTKLSSAGLIYAHYGREVIVNAIQNRRQLIEDSVTTPIDFEAILSDNSTLDVIFEQIYKSLVEEIDAIDNGVSATEEKPKYSISTNLSSRVSTFNPGWNSKNQEEMPQFLKAMEIVGEEFFDRIDYLVGSWIPARDIVRKAYRDRFEVHSDCHLIALTSGGVPWKEHLFQIEDAEGCSFEGDRDFLAKGSPLFLIFPDDTSGTWRVQAIPKSRTEHFESRLPLHKSWQGLRDAELSTVSEIAGGVFVHGTGFIGGNRTQEGAIRMALKTIEASKSGK